MKEVKTNAMRLLDKQKLAYQVHTYPHHDKDCLLYTSYWLTMAMINGNLFALVKLIGLSSLVLILFLLLIAPVWNALNQKARTTPVKAGGKVKLEASSMNAALLRLSLIHIYRKVGADK